MKENESLQPKVKQKTDTGLLVSLKAIEKLLTHYTWAVLQELRPPADGPPTDVEPRLGVARRLMTKIPDNPYHLTTEESEERA